MIFTVLPIIAPVFIVAGFGYAWARAGMRFDAETVSGLATYIGVPCLVFNSLAGITVELSELGRIALATVFALGGSLAVSAIVLRMMDLKLSHYLGAPGFPNLGNMGLPICLFAFGEQGLALGTGFFMVGAVANTSLGPFINSGKFSLAEAARTPVIYVILPALLVRFYGFAAPLWIANTTKLIGGMTIPLMLMLLGVSLSRVRRSMMWRSSALAVLRISMGLAVGWGVAGLLGAAGTLRGVLLLQTAMPTAVLNYVFALRYETDPETVAGIVLQSTLLSMLVLPVQLVLILH